MRGHCASAYGINQFLRHAACRQTSWQVTSQSRAARGSASKRRSLRIMSAVCMGDSIAGMRGSFGLPPAKAETKRETCEAAQNTGQTSELE